MKNKTVAVRATAAVWTAGVTAVLAGLPLVAGGRLPDRLATHWDLDGGPPDGSMPLWAASLVPALIWLVTAAATAVPLLRAGPAAGARWTMVVLLPTGVVLGGAQAAVVRANLDRADWHEARQPTAWIVAVLVLAVLAAVGGRLLATRRSGGDGEATPGADDDAASGADGLAPILPKGRRMAWFSRTANPWLHLVAAVTGLVAVAALVALAGGLAAPGALWALFAGFAAASLSCALFSSVQARVSERGLEVSFGPLGWPRRRWSPGDIDAARAEVRRPAQVGGWGYRLSGLGTTVMLRAGECLVVRPRGRRTDFAVSVDDAERGAALLNALAGQRSRP
ncbi:conserved membrane protein of unknown function [Streptomyces ambofaciens ATCC 23877]|uniref:DUF1648 domain-containing protein n=1 Tax=Streptomyces ambofaciens (strain ATCC 23877 / 3486 / DSM 40053 / JCM 4204 / NBRC 12836 / NRRL B-2516) TaxID=278992 RepID=A0A0K2AV48_STRA7|nr:DUF1648 domain-containing protein [Streptomyces ambofaciens]AKZ56889.1 conserved membrane protein of unknown function [Streptomyces ambofaciens ATCC 23877]